MLTCNLKGRWWHVEKPAIMGILNLTPDSFYSGSRSGIDAIETHAEKMILEGADILDLGGQSTRPGSTRITALEERKRVIPAITTIRKRFPNQVVSIDTYYSEVARAAVEAGADMINDISGGHMDQDILGTAAALGVPYICMHMRGQPETMQSDTGYEDVVREVFDYFIERIHACRLVGIKDIILDPGFGFGKSPAQNFMLIKHLNVFQSLGLPLLLGLSRKSTVYRTLGTSAEEALNGTTVLHTLALLQKPDLLRVHDVKEAREAIVLVQAYNEATEKTTGN